METNTETKRPSLFKQLLGAAGGAAIALVLYEGYTLGAPIVTAWLVTPQSQIDAQHPATVRVDGTVSEYEFNRMAAKAKEIYQKFSAEPQPKAEISATGIEVTQPSQTQSSSIQRVDLDRLVAQAQVSSSSSASPVSSASSVSSVSFASSISSSSRSVSVVSDAASSARSRAQEQAKLAGSKLPNSGIGTTVAAIGALAGTAFLRRRKSAR